MAKLNIKPKSDCLWDLVSLGEVMLRLDPGDERISTTRHFRVWEGGGEYNVARGLKRCFGMDTAIVTALADNPVGRLVEDLMLQGGVSQKYVRWTPYDGVGRSSRNGLNFTERGFGIRPALGCSDRGHTAVSQLKPGEIDWDQIFSKDGTRWFHTGGIFCALSETTPLVAQEAMEAAKRAGAIVSYDLNYRSSLWKSIGGKAKAQEVNRRLAPLVDVMLGNEEDFTAAYENLGRISYSSGDWQSAIATFRRGLQINPLSAELNYDLGLALTRSGDVAGARQALALARRLDPTLTEPGLGKPGVPQPGQAAHRENP